MIYGSAEETGCGSGEKTPGAGETGLIFAAGGPGDTYFPVFPGFCGLGRPLVCGRYNGVEWDRGRGTGVEGGDLSTRGRLPGYVTKGKTMKIAVVTPSGHVGQTVADTLLGSGKDIEVSLLCRRPEKLKDFIGRGAKTVVGSQDDAQYLVQATRGADALFWATPPGAGSDHVRAFQNRLARAGAEAIRTNGISHVVNLSSIGAHLDSGLGPINGLHDVEQVLNAAGENVLHLRPGFFFENLLMQRDAIRKWGRISLPLSGTRRFPMIATRDIGRIAAKQLTDRTWTGHVVRELHGAADLSFQEVAEILSQVFERKIVFIKCRPEEIRGFLISEGMSENAADLLLEMYDAMEAGRLRTTQPRSAETTTSTMLVEFARDVMLPLLAQPVSPHQEMD
jgi:uncharacterized protein YbjT (DUF2867 family)